MGLHVGIAFLRARRRDLPDPLGIAGARGDASARGRPRWRRKHVYVAGPVAAARLLWTRGDYARLVDAFGTVIDEIVVWPTEDAAPQKAEQPASPR